MSRFLKVFKNIFNRNNNEKFVKLVGTDRFQNKFYERLPGNRHFNSARRFYEPANYDDVRIHIDPAWEAWLRGTRKIPPTLEETILQENRRKQLAEKETNLSKTSYGVESAQGGTTSFPIRENYEIHPGSKKLAKSDDDQRF